MDDRLDNAQKILYDWQAARPDSAHPLFYAASITLAEAKDARGDQSKSLSNRALEQLDAFRDKVARQNSRSAEDELLVGMSEAFSARIFMDREEWLQAYKIGRKSRDRLRALIEKNPDQHDAYLVLGLYEFYTGNVPSALKWLTYLVDLSGNRKLGLDWLQRAVENAETASPEAARVLVEELPLEAPEVCQWLPLAGTLSEAYSNNAQLAYALQENYRRCGFPDQALRENLRASRQFRTNRRLLGRLIGQRLLIFRDLGDTKSMDALKPKFSDPDYFEKRLREGRHVAGLGASDAYSPPGPIRNARALKIKHACAAP